MQGDLEAIISLCDKVMGILGPAPSNYDTTLKYVGKRKLSDRDDGGGGGRGRGGGGGNEIIKCRDCRCDFNFTAADDDDVFYLLLQKQKSAQRYIPQGKFPP